MDHKDQQILRIIQKDAALSMNELADRTSMSKTAVWRRVKSLQDNGIIRKRVTLLDKEALGFGLTVYALVRTNQHSQKWFATFKKAVMSIPEIQEFHRTSGDLDYLLRIIARDMRHYDEVYQQLIREVDFADVSSTFVMETFKSDTELPI